MLKLVTLLLLSLCTLSLASPPVSAASPIEETDAAIRNSGVSVVHGWENRIGNYQCWHPAGQPAVYQGEDGDFYRYDARRHAWLRLDLEANVWRLFR